MTPSLEGWSTNAKKAPSPHEVRLTLLEHQPSITMSWGYLNVKGGYLFSSHSFCYFLVEWDGLHDHQRDTPWENILHLDASPLKISHKIICFAITFFKIA